MSLWARLQVGWDALGTSNVLAMCCVAPVPCTEIWVRYARVLAEAGKEARKPDLDQMGDYSQGVRMEI